MNRLIASTLLAAPLLATAQEPLALDIYAFGGLSFAEISGASGSENANGLDTGVRAVVRHTSGAFGYGEYTYGEIDDRVDTVKVQLEVDEFRVGGGYLMPVLSGVKAGGYAGYVNEKLTTRVGDLSASERADGFNVGAMIECRVSPTMQFYGRFGYLRLESDTGGAKVDGPDLNVGTVFEWAKGLAGYVEYRYTNLDGAGATFDYHSLRAGLKLSY